MKIILALDGSDQATEAAQFLARLPHREPLDLTILTVVSAFETSEHMTRESWYPKFMEQQEELADQYYMRAAKCFEGADASVCHHKARGHTGESIVEFAERTQADMIVLGSQGHSALSRLFLGSVSDFVATHAPCSVMVVRPTPAARTAKLKVTIAYDDSCPSRAILEQFNLFQWTSHVAVQVLSLVQRNQTLAGELLPHELVAFAEAARHAREAVNSAVAQLAAMNIQAESQVNEATNLGQAIVDIADEFQSSLLIVGDTGRSRVSRMLLGSVSRFVLRHATQSVWIIRQPKIQGAIA